MKLIQCEKCGVIHTETTCPTCIEKRQLKNQIKELREWIENNSEHEDECDFLFGKCTCGLDNLLKVK